VEEELRCDPFPDLLTAETAQVIGLGLGKWVRR
jgi:hypothetical protein